MVLTRLRVRTSVVFLLSCLSSVGVSSKNCRSVPGDALWPDQSTWAALNVSVSGRLIRNQPVAAVCYRGQDWVDYDANSCDFVTANWNDATLQAESPIGYQYPRDIPCPPSLNETYGKCSLGGSPVYTINATNHEHVSAGINFAREKNIRLVIKNTGHDMLGRSTGYGSLQIWTRYLRTGVDFANSFALSTPSPLCESAPPWEGPSIRIGGGYEWGEIYKVAAANNVILVGGATPTVGGIGGWLTGGGHSFLTHDYGLGADQLLEAQIVLANGELVIANACHNPSIFRAIRGGGPAYGVIVSGTWKAYPTQNVTAHSMSFVAEATSDTDAFLSALTDIYRESVAILDHGFTGYGVWSLSGQLTNPPFNTPTYTHTLLGLGKSKSKAEQVLEPLIDNVTSVAGLRVIDSSFTEYTTYADFQQNNFFTNSSAPAGVLVAWGSRLLDRQALTGDAGALLTAIRTLAGDASEGAMNGLIFVGGGKLFHEDETAPTSVLPAWRRTYVHALVQRMWTHNMPQMEVEALQDDITKIKTRALEKLAPDTGVYMNEADVRNPNWRKDFYGDENYRRLQGVKNLYDPEGLFYCSTCVGAERWEVSETGALCRKEDFEVV
ncbi:hypothetical protein PVAG01_08921 [Phlyctema vagabunda]|uniref:FAD-binding PCMH-type domain-containing protein n=1 Tax=Phlyctema vagabunda TaxID=108571 RepID=A0ABR4PAS8_9HELO